MGCHPKQYVGIDVSQDWLDIFIHPIGQTLHVANDTQGIFELVEVLRSHRISLVVCEATGGLEYRLARALDEAGIPTAVVNPAAPHAFRAAQGQRAKPVLSVSKGPIRSTRACWHCSPNACGPPPVRLSIRSIRPFAIS